jgi:hypothetical protein
MKIFVKHEGQKPVDITEGVQAMYDLLVSSGNWGSGLLSSEDAVPIANLAQACQFNNWEEAVRYLEQAKKDEESRKAFRKQPK